jgi:flagella basal body P-ring formation protein FlgA
VVTVPALTRDVAPGETIAEADLTTIEIAANRLSAQTLTQANAIAGQAARRMLRANTALQTYDVRKPVLIKKGELVTVTHALDGIALTAQGQAQADAGLGDAVPVLNTRSRRTIDARVTGTGTATVVVPNAAETLAAR